MIDVISPSSTQFDITLSTDDTISSSINNNLKVISGGGDDTIGGDVNGGSTNINCGGGTDTVNLSLDQHNGPVKISKNCENVNVTP